MAARPSPCLPPTAREVHQPAAGGCHRPSAQEGRDAARARALLRVFEPPAGAGGPETRGRYDGGVAGTWPARLPTGPPRFASVGAVCPSDTHTRAHQHPCSVCSPGTRWWHSASRAAYFWPGPFAEARREASPGCGLIAGLLTLHQAGPGTERKGAPAPDCGAEDGAALDMSLFWKSHPTGRPGGGGRPVAMDSAVSLQSWWKQGS